MPLQSVGELGRDQIQIDPAALLEISELGDLQAIQHHLPADAPGAQRGRFPVILFELDVVLARSMPMAFRLPRYWSMTSAGEGFRITCSCWCL